MIALAPEHLATLRKRQLLTQRDLARRAGIGPSTVALLEAGRSTPKIVTMRKICRALGLADPSNVFEFRQAINAASAPSSPFATPSVSRTITE